MPLPSSGQLSINQIRTEFGTSNGSLRTLSSLAGFSTPDKISDFYGYGAGGVYTVTNTDSSFCSDTSGLKNGSYYIGTAGANTVTGTINTGDTFQGFSGFDCYGSSNLYVYTNLRGYLFSGNSGVSFGGGIYSGTYTRLSGENITITGSFFAAEPPPPCFVAGTIIKLADGTEALIETLSEGVELESVLIDTLEDTNNVHELHMWSSNDLIETRTTSPISKFYPEEVYYTIIVNNGLLEATRG